MAKRQKLQPGLVASGGSLLLCSGHGTLLLTGSKFFAVSGSVQGNFGENECQRRLTAAARWQFAIGWLVGFRGVSEGEDQARGMHSTWIHRQPRSPRAGYLVAARTPTLLSSLTIAE
jgi:hypothetical protein